MSCTTVKHNRNTYLNILHSGDICCICV